MSRSPTITDVIWSDDPEDWLHNPHAGEIIALEFMAPLKLDAAELSRHLDIDVDGLRRIIQGDAPINAEADLRLARYFGMSEGFFLRLQNAYDLLEAKRALNGALDRIVPRAA